MARQTGSGSGERNMGKGKPKRCSVEDKKDKRRRNKLPKIEKSHLNDKEPEEKVRVREKYTRKD